MKHWHPRHREGWSPLDFLLSQTWYPLARAMDLYNDKGQIDHGKCMGFVAFSVFVWLALKDRLPPVGLSIAMMACVFGQRPFMAFLRSRTVTSHEEVLTVIGNTAHLRGKVDDPDVIR